MKKTILTILIAATALWCQGQPVTTILLNGTIHIGNGKVIPKGVVVFEQGKIVEVGVKQTALYKNAVVVDASGKHIYPGLICMNNTMGLHEIDAVRATHDHTEYGQYNANVRSITSYNTDSKILPTAVVTGILYTQPVPGGGTLSGTSGIMRTVGWNWEDAALKAEDGVHLNWPSQGRGRNHEQKQDNQLQSLEKFLSDATTYCNGKPEDFNARLEGMRPVLNGTINLYLHVNEAREIVRAVNFFKQKYPNVSVILVGASEAYLIKEFLAASGVPVILGNLHRLPGTPAEAVDQPYSTPGELVKAGITVAISHEGSWEARNLAYIAGTAAAYGMDKEQALMAITLTPAKIAGLAQRIGSIEVGKDASILMSEGDLLDMKQSNLLRVWLDGNELDLKNDQNKRAERYLRKYGLEP